MCILGLFCYPYCNITIDNYLVVPLCELIQGRGKVFTTGGAKFDPKHYVIKCVGGR